MGLFIKDNFLNIVLSALIGLSAYLVEKVITHDTKLVMIEKDLSDIKNNQEEIIKLLLQGKISCDVYDFKGMKLK